VSVGAKVFVGDGVAVGTGVSVGVTVGVSVGVNVGTGVGDGGTVGVAMASKPPSVMPESNLDRPEQLQEQPRMLPRASNPINMKSV
jgi:hypothetical protein